MAQIEQIIRGTEKKFAIQLKANGFSMDDNDFEIEVATPSESLKGYKNAPEGSSTDVLIFKETTTQTVENPEDPENPTEEEVNTWYCIVNTGAFQNNGELRVIGTAHVPDENANDGIRNEIAKTILGKLVNP